MRVGSEGDEKGEWIQAGSGRNDHFRNVAADAGNSKTGRGVQFFETGNVAAGDRATEAKNAAYRLKITLCLIRVIGKRRPFKYCIASCSGFWPLSSRSARLC